MRPSNKRSRSKQNRPRTLGNIVNRVFDSSGPEGKVRGTPQQIIDKYNLLARDAQLSGDRVAAENFLQHAEHYTRMLNEAQAEMARDGEQQRRDGGVQQNGQNRRFEPGSEGEAEAEGSEGFEPRQSEGRQFDGRQNDGRQNDGRQNDGRQNDGRQNDGRQGEPRSEARVAEPRATEPRSPEARPGEPRTDSRQDWKDRRNKRFDERRARRDPADPRDDQRPAPSGEGESMLVETPESRPDSRPEPRREPRPEPRSEPPIEAQLPDFLTAGFAPSAPVEADATEAAPKARPRSRPRKPRVETEGDAPAASSDAAE